MNINNFCERNPLSDSEWSRYKEKTTLDFSYSNTEDDVYFSDDELLLIACKYRINLAESINDLEDEYNFIKGFELNKDIKEKLTKLFHEKQTEILSKANNKEKE